MDDVLIERRVIVKGWKYKPERTFVSSHAMLNGAAEMERFVAQQRARIGEVVEEWQPHITEVIAEERRLSAWSVVTS